ncbi:hypothetical protein BpHYR1_006527 [Brachionus plicatilis]|uniref:Uncharacterized protein n=1 Tax=Brachionus plicatilis TaxID=10195 RepID=A0A3M7PLN4_BRAPC|nr:hypothetical protein BpHYR1_006527 [Brachionus plicatilis]
MTEIKNIQTHCTLNYRNQALLLFVTYSTDLTSGFLNYSLFFIGIFEDHLALLQLQNVKKFVIERNGDWSDH